MRLAITRVRKHCESCQTECSNGNISIWMTKHIAIKLYVHAHVFSLLRASEENYIKERFRSLTFNGRTSAWDPARLGKKFNVLITESFTGFSCLSNRVFLSFSWLSPSSFSPTKRIALLNADAGTGCQLLYKTRWNVWRLVKEANYLIFFSILSRSLVTFVK